MSRKTGVCLCITAVWGCLMFTLAQQRLPFLSSISVGRMSSAERHMGLPTDAPEGSLRMGIFVGERRVGCLVQQWNRRKDVLDVTAKMTVSLDAMLGIGPMMTSAEMSGALAVNVDSHTLMVGGALRTISVDARIDRYEKPFASIYGQMDGSRMTLYVRRGSQTDAAEFEVDPRNGIDFTSFPLAALPDLAIAKQWLVTSFNPLTLRLENAVARVTRRENLDNGGETAKTYVIQIGEGQRQTTIWANERGEILRQRYLGLTFVREDMTLPGLADLRVGSST